MGTGRSASLLSTSVVRALCYNRHAPVVRCCPKGAFNCLGGPLGTGSTRALHEPATRATSYTLSVRGEASLAIPRRPNVFLDRTSRVLHERTHSGRSLDSKRLRTDLQL